MGHRDDEIQRLERTLTESYRSQPDLPIGAVDVTQNVMRAIRQSTNSNARWIPTVSLDQLVWRTATITAAVVLVAMVLTVQMFGSPAGESAGLLAEEFDSSPLFMDY
ncbi:MAG TPA: hypothetical protein VEI50_11475 [Nitrospiraceae bacterium]|nr:hypothetical protein [Nitrospiraceae bacterium]